MRFKIRKVYYVFITIYATKEQDPSGFTQGGRTTSSSMTGSTSATSSRIGRTVQRRRPKKGGKAAGWSG